MDDFNVYGKPVLPVQHKHPLSSCSRKGKVALKCKQKGIFQLLRKLEPNVEWKHLELNVPLKKVSENCGLRKLKQFAT